MVIARKVILGTASIVAAVGAGVSLGYLFGFAVGSF